MPKGFLSWVSSKLLLQRSKHSSAPKEEGIGSFAYYLHRSPAFIPDFKRCLYHPSLKGILCRWKPSFKETPLHRKRGRTASPFPTVNVWDTEHLPCPATHTQTFRSTSLFRDREKGRKMLERKSMPAHRSILTNILFGSSLLCSIYRGWRRHCPPKSKCCSRVPSLNSV